MPAWGLSELARDGAASLGIKTAKLCSVTVSLLQAKTLNMVRKIM
jgi:hypothetical protein